MQPIQLVNYPRSSLAEHSSLNGVEEREEKGVEKRELTKYVILTIIVTAAVFLSNMHDAINGDIFRGSWLLISAKEST